MSMLPSHHHHHHHHHHRHHHRSRFLSALLIPSRCGLLCTGRYAPSEAGSDVASHSALLDHDQDNVTEYTTYSEDNHSTLEYFGDSVCIDLGELGETSTEGLSLRSNNNSSCRARNTEDIDYEWSSKHARLSENLRMQRNEERSTDSSGTRAGINVSPSARSSYLDGDYLFNFERQREYTNSISHTWAPWTSSWIEGQAVLTALTNGENSDSASDMVDSDDDDTDSEDTNSDSGSDVQENANNIESMTADIENSESNVDIDREACSSDNIQNNDQEVPGLVSNIEFDCEAEHSCVFDSSSAYCNTDSITIKTANQLNDCDSNGSDDNAELSADESSNSINMTVQSNTNLQTDNLITNPTEGTAAVTNQDFVPTDEFFNLCSHDTSVNTSPSSDIDDAVGASNTSTPSRVSLCSTLLSITSESSSGALPHAADLSEDGDSARIPLFNRPALPAASRFMTNQQQQQRQQRQSSLHDDMNARFASIFAEIPPNVSEPVASDSRSSTMNSRASSSSTSSGNVQTVQQQWYFYDPRLVHEARTRRIEMATTHRGQTNAWSMPGIVLPPSYNEVNQETDTTTNSSTVPPPYEEQHIEHAEPANDIVLNDPPPTYAQSQQHRLLEQNDGGSVSNAEGTNQTSRQPQESGAVSIPNRTIQTQSFPTAVHSYPPPTYSLARRERRASSASSELSSGITQADHTESGDTETNSSTSELHGLDIDVTINTTQTTSDSRREYREEIPDIRLGAPQPTAGDVDSERVDLLDHDEDIESNDDGDPLQLSHTLRRYPVGSMMGQRPVLRWTGAVSDRRMNTTQNWFM